MTLDIVEEHLYRGHPEVVGAEEEHGQLQALDLVEGAPKPQNPTRLEIMNIVIINNAVPLASQCGHRKNISQ